MRTAAVIIPFFRRGGELFLVLVRRGEKGIHGGQIGFPGGKLEPGDASLLETALRETEEEIGLTRNHIEILEALPPLKTRTTNFRITPFLARIQPLDPWRPRTGEIAEVMEVKVKDLLDPAALGETVMTFETWSGPQRRPYLRIGSYRLWGATHRMLLPLLRRIEQGELAL